MRDELVPLLVAFGRAVRAAGVTAGSGDIETYCAAMVTLDPTDLMDLYWGGRTALVKRRDDIPTYDEVFRAFFLGEHQPVQELLTLHLKSSAQTEAVLDVPATDPPDPAGEQDEEETFMGLMASSVASVRNKSFVACTPDELAALRRIMRQFRLTPPKRRTRRTRPSRRGHRPDLRRTVRESLRLHGEPVALHWQRRRVKLRPLVLVLDVSGSMADYSRALLQFAHTARRASQKVEVFCFGTRLTRITVPLQKRSPDAALADAARLVVDWEGGTRIGSCLDEFARTWGRRGIARGGVVVICSDGYDRGKPDTLALAMERLSRLSHTIVWLNPHKGNDPSYRPQSLGMMVAEPFIDVLLSGHDLESLAEFAQLLPGLA
ncbi:vWA domain-containing protein [Pseudonocardia sp. GCM10023141]|uniref:vWA domain-containing protein n=1 Tax=Pseudonocardia sp. GCM10023141 TaxID=3252653 RepID=UPI003606B243